MDIPAIDNETAFAELIREFEDHWVAIDVRDGVKFIVGSGKDAVEAAQAAEANGYPDAALLRVPSFSSTFIPSATHSPRFESNAHSDDSRVVCRLGSIN